MILGWSPYSGSEPDSAPHAAISYLVDALVTKDLDGKRVRIVRDPAPEILAGHPGLMRAAVNVLPWEKRYSIATMSFAREDVDIESFNAGDPVPRQAVAQALGLFFEVAYAGLPRMARLKPLITTHTHTGRLEVNVMMPRAAWTSQGRLRAYNPHPPGAVSIQLWDVFRDLVNARFGWQDPNAASRRRLVAFPNWLLKREAEALRHGNAWSDDLKSSIEKALPDHVIRGTVRDRATFVELLKPTLHEEGFQIRREARDSVTVYSETQDKAIQLRGHCFSEQFNGGPLPSEEEEQSDTVREAQATDRLCEGLQRRARFNSSRYAYPDMPVPDLEAMLAAPGLPLRSPYPGENYLDRHPNATRTDAAEPVVEGHEAAGPPDPRPGGEGGTDGRAARDRPAAGGHHSETGGPRGAAGGGSQGPEDGFILAQYADRPDVLIGLVTDFLRRLVTRLRRRQADHLVIARLRRIDIDAFRTIRHRWEKIHETTARQSRVAGTAGRVAQADGAYPTVASHHRPGSAAGDLRPSDRTDDRAVADRRRHPHVGGGDGETRAVNGHPSGLGAKQPEPDQAHVGNAKGYPMDPRDARSASAEGSGRKTRADMILEMRRIALLRGEAMPKVKFIHEDDIGEQILATFKSEILYHDGEAVRHMDGRLYDAEHEDPMPRNDPEP